MKRDRLHAHSLAPLLLLWVVTAWLASSQRAAAQLLPFSPEEKARIEERLLAEPGMRALATARADERLRVLTIVPVEPEKEGPTYEGRRLAGVTLVQYRAGAAFRLLVDAQSGEQLSMEPLRGRPQASVAERDEARALIRRALQIPEALDLVGGFVVAPPAGEDAKGRYLEFHIVGEDRLKIEREVVADLATGRVVSDRGRNYD